MPGAGVLGGMSSQGTKGPAFLSSSPVIKRSQCQYGLEPKPHSPVVPKGRMKRGFHGYHAKEENIQIKPESKVCLVSFSLNLVSRQGSREGKEVQRGGGWEEGSRGTEPEGTPSPSHPSAPGGVHRAHTVGTRAAGQGSGCPTWGSLLKPSVPIPLLRKRTSSQMEVGSREVVLRQRQRGDHPLG